jgi:hypothetical protein
VTSKNLCAALCLAAGVILYVSAVNDEVSNRRKARLYDKFKYNYGWSLAILTLPFISALACSVINVTVYIKRIKHRDSIIYKTIPALYELLLITTFS